MVSPNLDKPFNIDLLILDKEQLKGVQPVTVLDIFETAGSKAFHPQGLFSTEIFGKVGEEKRNRMFGYIDLKVDILHPVIFKSLTDMKELYTKVLNGTAYARLDPQEGDLVPSTPSEGGTGFEFFIQQLPHLKLDDRGSTSREFAIRLLEKYKHNCLMNKLVVMPAGLRDFTINPSGKPEEDEINNLYRRVLATTNVITTSIPKSDMASVDQTRYNIQLAVNAVYTYITSLLEGKHRLIQGWWTSRRVFRSTRNVITSNVPRTEELFDERTIGPNHTVVGLYQTLFAIFPVAVNCIREILAPVFSGPNSPANLIDKKTLKSTQVSIKPDVYDAYMTPDGLEKTIGRLEVEELRDEIAEASNHYLALVYNDGKRVKLFYDIDDLPEGLDKAHVKPVTYAELYYLAVYKKVREIPAFNTRYPITGYGSIYPSWIYLKTTTNSLTLDELGDDWQTVIGQANEYPIVGTSYVNALSPSSSHLSRLGADSNNI